LQKHVDITRAEKLNALEEGTWAIIPSLKRLFHGSRGRKAPCERRWMLRTTSRSSRAWIQKENGSDRRSVTTHNAKIREHRLTASTASFISASPPNPTMQSLPSWCSKGLPPSRQAYAVNASTFFVLTHHHSSPCPALSTSCIVVSKHRKEGRPPPLLF